MSKAQAIPSQTKKIVYAHIVAILAELEDHQTKVGQITDMILTELGMTEPAVVKARRRRHERRA